jgi:two-component system, NtrC family, response regulator AtoC
MPRSAPWFETFNMYRLDQSSNGQDSGVLQTPAKTVVVLDTDAGIRWALSKGLALSGYHVETAHEVGEALHWAQKFPVSAFVVELLPEAGLTLDVIQRLLESPSQPRVVTVSIDSSPHTVIECMRRGASDFLPKPFSLAELRAALSRALESRPHRLDSASGAVGSGGHLRDARDDGSFLVGISPNMQELRGIIEQVAKTDLNCFIRGESGTGKDMVAREIHRLSRRRDKPFIKVNCSAIPEHLLESELFGYERGAFTGAVTAKPGRFDLADGGIIFLDEIGDLHPSLQAKLLQVIEHKEFTRLGGTRHARVDLQIITATNADIEEKIKIGTFRGDLSFRLDEVCIWLPPLRDRREDIPLLLRHFMKKHVRAGLSSQLDITGPELQELCAYDWPGNVRELESTVKRWLVLGSWRLPQGNRRGAASPGSGAAVAEPAVEKRKEVEDLTPEQLLQTLQENKWNRRKVAEALGMSYQTLRRRIEKFKLDERR